MQNKLFQEHLNGRKKVFDIGHLCTFSVEGLYRNWIVVYTERALAPHSYMYVHVQYTVHYSNTPTPPHHPPPFSHLIHTKQPDNFNL
jgi:hypothetical protein